MYIERRKHGLGRGLGKPIAEMWKGGSFLLYLTYSEMQAIYLHMSRSDSYNVLYLTYSEMQAIASGNPLIKEKISLDNDIAELRLLKSEHEKEMFRMQDMAERKLPELIENYADLLEKASRDLKAYQAQNPENAPFKIKINGKDFDDRVEAGKELDKAILKCTVSGESRNIGEYYGFRVLIGKNDWDISLDTSLCYAELHGNLVYKSDIEKGNPLGNIRRIENLAGIQINQRISNLSASLDKAKSDLEEARASLNKPFERAAELEEKLKRIAVVNNELSVGGEDDDIPIDGAEPAIENNKTYAAEKPNLFPNREPSASPPQNQHRPKFKSR